jgi:hypothetical protein
MPAKSEAQKRLMDAAAHNPKFAKKVGVPSKVAKDFSETSIGMKFKKGGAMPQAQRQSLNEPKTNHGAKTVNEPKTNHGEQSLFSKGGKTMDKKDIKQDKAIVKKAIGMHDKQLHGGKKTNMAKLAKGGGVETKGKTKGKMIAMCGGGMAKKK